MLLIINFYCPFIFFFHLQPQDGVRVFFPDIVDKFASDAGPTAGFLDINVLDPHAWPAKFCGKAFCDHAIALDLAGNLKNIAFQIWIVIDAVFNIGAENIIGSVSKTAGDA